MADAPPIAFPDGTDPDAYRGLEGLDRSGWAWEWLRRDPGYRGAGVSPAGKPASPRMLPGDRGDPQRGLLFRRGSLAARA